jgi:hypothetical protein
VSATAADDLTVKPLDDPSTTGWLQTVASRGGWCGFDAVGWPKAVWILHAMYERSDLPDGLTHDDAHRIEQAVKPPTPPLLGDRQLQDVLDSATVIGSSLGISRRPNPGWRRLRWHDLARRVGVNPFREDRLPSYRSFEYASWPVSIRPPAEGALDREQYRRLLSRLAEFSPDGDHTECFVRYAPCWDSEREHVLVGTIRDARRQYDVPPTRRGAPNNLWPRDRSWFVYTDYDLWGTKVSGSQRLIASLMRDRDLETVDLDR